MEWTPINKPPKIRQHILTYSPIFTWEPGFRYRIIDSNLLYTLTDATHYMLLPKPPLKRKGQKNDYKSNRRTNRLYKNRNSI